MNDPVRPRLIAIDLDGTLLRRDKRPSPRTRRALDIAASRGCRVVIATGRSYDILRLFCEGIALNAPQITYNGAVVHDPMANRELYQCLVPPAFTRPTVEFFLTQGVPVGYFTPGELFLDRRLAPEDWVPRPLTPPTLVDDVRAVADLPCIKVVGGSPGGVITRIRPLAEDRFGRDLYVTRTASDLLEFLHPDVSKGAALARIADTLSIEREDVVAFGDSHNDLGMLQFAGVGVAMGNASDELKEAADIVTASNEEDGIAVALERLGIV